jgi:Uma2 family endonuclease
MSEQITYASLETVQRLLSKGLMEVRLTPREPSKMTFQEFLDRVDEDTLAEWVALPGEETGEVVMTSPASSRHQDISDFLTSVMRSYVESRSLGVLRSAPFQMKLKHSSREPDLLFVRQEHLERLKDTYLDGPADLAVEIVSPESVGRDRGEKFYEYAQGGVPEYWLIDPQTQWAEFYQLQETYYYQAFSGRQGRYQALALPGFWLQVEWLWQEPLPSIIRTLVEIMGIDPAVVDAFEKTPKSK